MAATGSRYNRRNIMIHEKRNFTLLWSIPLAALATALLLFLAGQAASAAPGSPDVVPALHGSVGNHRFGHNPTLGPNLASGDGFGAATAAGDINGDGRQDVIVGAPGDDHNGPDRGAIYVGFRGLTATFTSFVKVASNLGGGPVLSNTGRFGSAVAVIGDLNGDGVPEVAVGAPYNDEYGTDRGIVYVNFMRTNGTVSTTRVIASGVNGGPFLANGDRFGFSIARLGDLNNDGVPDLAVGAPGHTVGGITSTGAVYVAFMRANGDFSSTVRLSSPAINVAAGGMLGYAVAGLGDLDADGNEDLAATAPYSGSAGSTLLINLRNTGAVTRVVRFEGFSTWPARPMALGANGDISGNGIPDVLIGFPEYATGSTTGGWRGDWLTRNSAGAGFVAVRKGVAGGPAYADGVRYGESIALMDDIDGNGARDVVVGAGNDGGSGAIYLTRLGTLYADNAVTRLSSHGVVTAGQHVTVTVRYTNSGQIEGNTGLYTTLPAAMTSLAWTHSATPSLVEQPFGLALFQLRVNSSPLGEGITINMGGVISTAMAGRTYTFTTEAESFAMFEQNFANNVVTHTFTVANLPPVLAAATAPHSPVSGVAGRFAITLSQGTNNMFVWDMGDGNVFTDTAGMSLTAGRNYSYALPGTYTATLHYFNPAGSGSVQLPVLVQPAPPVLQGVESPGLPTAGVAGQFTATLLAGTSVALVWDMGDGSVFTDTTTSNLVVLCTHSYAAWGTYTVTVRAANAVGTSEASRVLDVYAPLGGVSASFASSAFKGAPVSFAAGHASGSTPTLALWDFGDGATANGMNAAHSYAQPGTYTVRLTLGNALGTQIIERQIVIEAGSRAFLPAVAR